MEGQQFHNPHAKNFMPTYDYECEACGHTTEIFQRITEEPITTCPVCKKKKFKRLFGTGAAVVFKGSGFYQTDYRSESYKKAAEKESKSGESAAKTETTGSGKPESGSGESKPAVAKTDPAPAKETRRKKADPE
jgi:putative FmdB family regulatory protein